MAEAIRDAYADLFQVNTSAQKLSKTDVVNKFKTLSQGQYSESVLDKMAMTFGGLVKLANFEVTPPRTKVSEKENSVEDIFESSEREDQQETLSDRLQKPRKNVSSLGGLHYNIQIILPDSRDPAVYDALFRSLREHLF